jgi:hypothetical protein
MKAIVRRLTRLEQSSRPFAYLRSQSPAEVLWERGQGGATDTHDCAPD